MSPSKFAYIGAITVAVMTSFTDALCLNSFPPDWLIRLSEIVGFPGNLAAWFINGAFGWGHSVTVPIKEFVLSLPFNFVWWLLWFRVGATIAAKVSPQRLIEKR